MSQDTFYDNMAKELEKTLGRQVFTAKDLKQIVNEAGQVRQKKGLLGLRQYAEGVKKKFTAKELAKLQKSEKYSFFAQSFIKLLLAKGVINRFEATFVRRYL